METNAEVVDLAALEQAWPAAVETDVTPPRARRAHRALWWALACATTDASMFVFAWLFQATLAIVAGVGALPFAWTPVLAAASMMLFARAGLYTSRPSIRTLDAAAAIIRGTLASTVTLLAVEAVHPTATSPGALIRFGALAAVCVTLGRLSFYSAHLRGRRAGEGMRRTLVVGAGTVGRLLTHRLLACPELGLTPVGYVDEYPMPLDRSSDMPVLGRASDLEDVILRHGIEHVVFSFSAAREEDSVAALSRCEQLGVGISVVPRLYEKTTSRLEVDHLGGLPLVHLPYLSPVSWQFAIKHAIDRVVAAVALLLLAPVLVAAAVAVRVSLGSPILFRQRRVGRDGRVFTILKFRSMRPGDADAPESERLTRAGAFIRRTSIDELPQLLNVLKGEMSLVGPRPERPELVQSFERTIHRYDERHRVKSGITGWAQVHGIGRGADRFGNVSLTERVEWDNFYIENWSLWLDAKIAMMTVLAVLRFRQAD